MILVIFSKVSEYLFGSGSEGESRARLSIYDYKFGFSWKS